MATGPNFAPPLPLMQPPACRLLDPPNSPPIDPFLADRLRNHRHLAIAPGGVRVGLEAKTKLNRKDYGINYNELLETGVMAVGEEVELEINTEAIKEAVSKN